MSEQSLQRKLPRHTPGPWIVTETRSAYGVYSEPGALVAVVAATSTDRPLARANAALIAAAPDLYDGLVELLNPNGGVYGTEAKVTRAIAALVKAEGAR